MHSSIYELVTVILHVTAIYIFWIFPCKNAVTQLTLMKSNWLHNIMQKGDRKFISFYKSVNLITT